MSDVEKKLLNIFGSYSVAEIEANSGFLLKEALGIDNYRQAFESEDYKRYYNTLKELRQKLDDVVTDTKGINQVKGCLFQLRETKENGTKKDFHLLAQLIKLGLYKKWKKKAREYYDVGWRMLTEWKDFFLSYTNKNLIETNNNFQRQLRWVFGKKGFEPERERVNCVARLIVHYLNKNNLNAFFDQDNIKCGDKLKEKVFKYCTDTFAFVQLVETKVFQEESDRKVNWCYREFKAFQEWNEQNKQRQLELYKPYYFIFEGPIVFPANFPGDYKDWKDTIHAHHYVRNLSALANRDIEREIGKIAEHIMETKKRILEDYTE